MKILDLNDERKTAHYPIEVIMNSDDFTPKRKFIFDKKNNNILQKQEYVNYISSKKLDFPKTMLTMKSLNIFRITKKAIKNKDSSNFRTERNEAFQNLILEYMDELKTRDISNREYYNILKKLSGTIKNKKILSLGNTCGCDQLKFSEFQEYLTSLYENENPPEITRNFNAFTKNEVKLAIEKMKNADRTFSLDGIDSTFLKEIKEEDLDILTKTLNSVNQLPRNNPVFSSRLILLDKRKKSMKN